MKRAACACASTRTARNRSFSCIILTVASASSELAALPGCRSRRLETGPGSCAGSSTRAATQSAMSATAAGSRRSTNFSDTSPRRADESNPIILRGRRFPPPWTIEELNDGCLGACHASPSRCCSLSTSLWRQSMGRLNAPHYDFVRITFGR
jgi:hypothetical protein